MDKKPPLSKKTVALVYAVSVMCSISASELVVVLQRTDWGYLDAALLPVVISLYSMAFGCLVWLMARKMG